jgi:hypothetical protein
MNHIDHLEHLEDLPVLQGFSGAMLACSYLRSVNDWLAGVPNFINVLSIKWDGSFSFVAGVDPKDGRFFVGTKAAFNKIPIVYKDLGSLAIHLYSKPDLRDRLAALFVRLGTLITEGTYQGDFMWSLQDWKTTEIGGKEFEYIQPNTIAYMYPTKIAEEIRRQCDIGVALHTYYKGSPGEFVQQPFQSPRGEGCYDVQFFGFHPLDYSFNLMPSKKHASFERRIQQIENSISQYCNKLNLYASSDIPPLFKQWMNSGSRNRFMHFLRDHFDAEKEARKTANGKATQELLYEEMINTLGPEWATIYVQIVAAIQSLKNDLLDKLDELVPSNCCYTTKGSKIFSRIPHEGYVIRRCTGVDAAKIVNRSVFPILNNRPDVYHGWER